MHANSLMHLVLGLFACVAGGDTTWQVGRVGGVVAVGFFDYDEEAVH